MIRSNSIAPLFGPGGFLFPLLARTQQSTTTFYSSFIPVNRRYIVNAELWFRASVLPHTTRNRCMPTINSIIRPITNAQTKVYYDMLVITS